MVISRSRLLKSQMFMFVMTLLLLYPKVISYDQSFISKSLRVVFTYLPYTLYLLIILWMWKVNKKSHKLYYCLLLFEIVLLISDIYNGADLETILRWYRNASWVLATSVLFGSALWVKPQKTICTIRSVCNVMVYINFCTTLLFPDGVARLAIENSIYHAVTWTASVGFIDADNRLSLFFLFAIFINVLYIKYINDKKIYYLPLLIMFINMLLVWSGTGLVTLTIVCSYLLFSNSKIVNKIVRGYWIFGAYTILLITFVFLQQFNIFKDLIVNVLHKDMTLANRTLLWAKYITMFLAKPVLGYGTTESGALISLNGELWYAHNQILDVMIQGGVIALIAFVLLLVLFKRHIDRSSDYFLSGLCTVCLFGYLIMGIAEHFIINLNMCFWAYLAIGYNVSLLNNSNTKQLNAI